MTFEFPTIQSPSSLRLDELDNQINPSPDLDIHRSGPLRVLHAPSDSQGLHPREILKKKYPQGPHCVADSVFSAQHVPKQLGRAMSSTKKKNKKK